MHWRASARTTGPALILTRPRQPAVVARTEGVSKVRGESELEELR